ncbi:PaaX family transcriptional regulator C-terminal domain-containing protein [Amycolatopsis sp. GM8]|uniref:PaaX family transcriptional regulator n=1 Tax=Amycolatopsis sp. GM8 TaxID=2896530 RepID=UPI001F36467E|nr:PaaX family transcriptional regulator C-terminal domain-containing protein [Amycolatopsis sp. GM8]
MNAQAKRTAEARAKPTYPGTVFAEFLSMFVRPNGNWAPVSAMVGLMGEIGFDEPGVRALISRQKSRGWLVPEKRGPVRGYHLTETALSGLAESDKIVWHARDEAPADDGWVLVTFSVPESVRAKRHVLRSRLVAIGFGTIGPGTLIAPARMLGATQTVLWQHDLGEFVDVFVAQLPPGGDAAGIVRRGWDLTGLNDEYRDFVRVEKPIRALWESRSTAAGADLDAEAFCDYLLAFNRWRRLPLRDPGLPHGLIGSKWEGRAAGELFECLVDLLDVRAQRHVGSFWP